MKFLAVTHSDVFDYFDEIIKPVFYTDCGAVRNPVIGPIEIKQTLDHYRMTVCGSTHYGVTIKKIEIEPLDDFRAGLQFQVSYTPNGRDLSILAEHLGNEIEISIEPDSGELEFGENKK